MDMKVALKKIRYSVAYGISNDIGGRWGRLLKIYTFIWVVYALFLTLAGASNGIKEGFLAFLLMLIVVVPVFTLPPFTPIYIAWLRHTKRVERETIRKKKEKEIFDSITIKVDVPKPLKMGNENPIKLTVNNPTEVAIKNVRFISNFPKLVKCDESVATIDVVPARSSKYTAIFIIPRIQDTIDLGEISVNFGIDGNVYEKGSIAIGAYEVVDVHGLSNRNENSYGKNSKGDVQKVINVSIRDSLIQRSNLLNSCDLDEDCMVKDKNISYCKTEMSDT